MVKMPAQIKKSASQGEEVLVLNFELAKIHLKRFCFLGTFEPAMVHRKKDNLEFSSFYRRLNLNCQLVESLPMFQILRTAYGSVLPRRDEVAALHATYLLGDVPIEMKTDLRSHFPKLVKTDDDLFMFCKYAALIHHAKKQPVFCKTIKKAITSWYKTKTPEEMAHMFAANRGMYGFTHRALIKLCRITDSMLGTKYLYDSFNKKCKEIVKNADNPLPALPPPMPEPTVKLMKQHDKNQNAVKKIESKNNASSIDVLTTELAKAEIAEKSKPMSSSSKSSLGTVNDGKTTTADHCDQEKIRSIIVGISTLRTMTADNAEEASKIVEKLNLKYEQLPYHFLQYPEVLKTVAKSMSCSQLVKCLHSEKIRKHFAKQDVLKVCRDRFQRKGGLKDECVDPIMFLMSMDKMAISHPLKPTNNKNTSRGRLVQFSKQLYRMSFREMKSTNLRIHITINLQHNYKKKILKNTKSVSYLFAAVALAFSFYKVNENCHVHRWTEAIHQLLPIEWNRNMDFVGAFTLCSDIKNIKNHQRLYVPMIQANEKERDYDLFIVIVPAATRGNRNNSSEMLADILEKYRTRRNVKSKFVIVDLLRHKKSMKYSQTKCENILEICGLDEHTIPLIQNFALNNFD